MINRRSFLLFTLPALLVLGAFFVYPIVLTAQMSFTNFSGVGAAEWTGWRNYERLISRDRYPGALWVTIKFTFVVVTVQTLAGLAFAAMRTACLRCRTSVVPRFLPRQ